jgi:GxxExxY protein
MSRLGDRGARGSGQAPAVFACSLQRYPTGSRIPTGFVVDECVLVELKTVEQLSDLHMSQILTYLKLSGMSLGYLLNFNVRHMKQGIKRVVYRLN